MGDKAYVSLAKQVRDMYIKDRPNSFQSNEGKTSSFLRRPSPPQRAMSYPDESSMDSALGSPGRNGRSESLDSFQFSYFHNKPDVATNQYQPHQPLLPVVSRDKGVAYITPSTVCLWFADAHCPIPA
jgi:hypothetical protein